MNQEYEIKPIKPDSYSIVASVYAQVFAGEPWKEVSRCLQCGNFSSTYPGERAPCTCGGAFSEIAYPLAETATYVEQEVQRFDAIGLFLTQALFLRKSEQTVGGFSWGFRMSPAELAQAKYRTAEMQQLVSDLLVTSGFFYYVSEVGVLPEMQGLGYGKQLTQEVVTQASQRGYSQFVVRTNEDSAMRYILEKMGMRPIIGLETGLKDKENEARVLFVGQR